MYLHFSLMGNDILKTPIQENGSLHILGHYKVGPSSFQHLLFISFKCYIHSMRIYLHCYLDCVMIWYTNLVTKENFPKLRKSKIKMLASVTSISEGCTTLCEAIHYICD